jgi:hypothetical protein
VAKHHQPGLTPAEYRLTIEELLERSKVAVDEQNQSPIRSAKKMWAVTKAFAKASVEVEKWADWRFSDRPIQKIYKSNDKALIAKWAQVRNQSVLHESRAAGYRVGFELAKVDNKEHRELLEAAMCSHVISRERRALRSPDYTPISLASIGAPERLQPDLAPAIDGALFRHAHHHVAASGDAAPDAADKLSDDNACQLLKQTAQGVTQYRQFVRDGLISRTTPTRKGPRDYGANDRDVPAPNPWGLKKTPEAKFRYLVEKVSETDQTKADELKAHEDMAVKALYLVDGWQRSAKASGATIDDNDALTMLDDIVRDWGQSESGREDMSQRREALDVVVKAVKTVTGAKETAKPSLGLGD